MDAPLSMQDAICVCLAASSTVVENAQDYVVAARRQVEARGKALISVAEAQALRERTEAALADAVQQEEYAKAQAAVGA